MFGSFFIFLIKSSYQQYFIVSSLLSTIKLGTQSHVNVTEEIVMGFKGDFGSVQRAICESNLPFYAITFKVDNLSVTSN